MNYVCPPVVVLGYLLSCSVDELEILNVVVPVLLIPLTLFAGYYINTEYVIKSVTKYTPLDNSAILW